MPLPVPPFYVVLTNFYHYRENNHLFMSVPFFSHAGGYKMAMTIRPNGFSVRQGTHVSLHVCLLPGEFDDQLHWPFNGKINCRGVSERWSFKQVIEMNEDIWDATVVSRCYDKILRGCAGIHDFLSFTYLDKYISRANSLRIRITKIEI